MAATTDASPAGRLRASNRESFVTAHRGAPSVPPCGDTARALFQEHGAAVYRFALVLVRHHQDAEDVLQETFLELLRHLTVGGNTDNLRGWLFTVAAHAARDRQRRRGRWVPWTPSHDSPVAPLRLPDEDGRLTLARAAMRRLADRDRLLIALRAQGLSYREIAAAAQIRLSSVGRLLARALDRWDRACRRAAPLGTKTEGKGIV